MSTPERSTVPASGKMAAVKAPHAPPRSFSSHQEAIKLLIEKQILFVSTEELSSEPKDPPLEVLRELSTKIHIKLIELLTMFTKILCRGMSKDQAIAHQKDVLNLVDEAIALGRFANQSYDHYFNLHRLMFAMEKENELLRERWFDQDLQLCYRVMSDLEKRALGEMKNTEKIVETMFKSVDILSEGELFKTRGDYSLERFHSEEKSLWWEQIRTLCLLPLHFIQPQKMKSIYGHILHHLEQCLRSRLALYFF